MMKDNPYAYKYPRYYSPKALHWIVKPGHKLVKNNEQYTVTQQRRDPLPGALPELVLVKTASANNDE